MLVYEGCGPARFVLGPLALAGIAMAQAVPADPQLHFGRLVDVYGARAAGPGAPAGKRTIEPYRRDVLVGTQPAVLTGDGLRLLPANPASGRTRVLIDAEPGSTAFVQTWDRLVGSVEALAGRLPRDAALRVQWAGGVPAGAEAVVCIELAALAAKVPLPVHRGPDSLWFDAKETVSTEVPPSGLPEGKLRLRLDPALPVRPFTVAGSLPSVDPLRILASLPMRLVGAARFDADTWILSVDCGAIRQALDPGDMVRLPDPVTGQPLAVVEVEVEVPTGDVAGPALEHVPVRCEPGSPAEAALVKLAPLAGTENGPKVVVVVPFDAASGDDPANFVRVTSRVVVDTEANDRDVSPQDSFELCFSAPVDLSTMRSLWLEEPSTNRVVPTRLFASDESGCRFRVEAPLGLMMNDVIRKAIRADRDAQPPRPHIDYQVALRAGAEGVRSRAGAALVSPFRFGFALDPDAPDNLVGFAVFGGK